MEFNASIFPPSSITTTQSDSKLCFSCLVVLEFKSKLVWEFCNHSAAIMSNMILLALVCSLFVLKFTYFHQFFKTFSLLYLILCVSYHISSHCLIRVKKYFFLRSVFDGSPQSSKELDTMSGLGRSSGSSVALPVNVCIPYMLQTVEEFSHCLVVV